MIARLQCCCCGVEQDGQHIFQGIELGQRFGEMTIDHDIRQRAYRRDADIFAAEGADKAGDQALAEACRECFERAIRNSPDGLQAGARQGRDDLE